MGDHKREKNKLTEAILKIMNKTEEDVKTKGASITDMAKVLAHFNLKRWNYFHHPMAGTIDNLEGVIDSDKQISAQIQIANKKFPEQEITSISEFVYFLRRAVNVMSPYYDGFSIDIYRYANDKFIGGIHFDKQPDMNFTGSNTTMGSFITFKIKATNANFALGIQRVFITAVSEQIFELSESASTVLD